MVKKQDAAAPQIDWSDDRAITLPEYAKRVGRSIQSVYRDIKPEKGSKKPARVITWEDPLSGKKVTSFAAIRRMQDAVRKRAEDDFLQTLLISNRKS